MPELISAISSESACRRPLVLRKRGMLPPGMTRCSTGERLSGWSALAPSRSRLLHLQRVQGYAAQVALVHPDDELVRSRLGQGQVLDVHDRLGEGGLALEALLVEPELRLHRLSHGLEVGVDEGQLDLMRTCLRSVPLDPYEQ